MLGFFLPIDVGMLYGHGRVVTNSCIAWGLQPANTHTRKKQFRFFSFFWSWGELTAETIQNYDASKAAEYTIHMHKSRSHRFYAKLCIFTSTNRNLCSHCYLPYMFFFVVVVYHFGILRKAGSAL